MCILEGELDLVNLPMDDGGTPLYLAAQDGHTECVRLLLKYGADVNALTNFPSLSRFTLTHSFSELSKYQTRRFISSYHAFLKGMFKTHGIFDHLFNMCIPL